MLKLKYNNSNSGQTLIETIIAIFILVTALTSGLGMVIYATRYTNQSKQQIIASNLAREGIEVVRMFRDTNWLSAQDTAAADLQDCVYDASDPTKNRSCYPEAFDEPIDLETSVNLNNYRLQYSPGASTLWILDTRNGNETFFLCLQADGMYRHDGGAIACSGATASFARTVQITAGNVTYPYTLDASNPNAGAGHSPEKIITSTVIWRGPGCADWPVAGATFPTTFVTKCKISMSERITNWKDYQ